MTTKELSDNITKYLPYFFIVLGAAITLKVWPVRERLSIAEEKVQALTLCQEEIKKELKDRPTEKELKPIIEALKENLERNNDMNKELVKSILELQQVIIELKGKIK